MSLLLLAALSVAAPSGWEQFGEEDGVRLWKKEVEGSSFVSFRGRGIVQASLREVAAVIRSADRETRWMANCVDAATVRWLSTNDAIVYHRTGSPAPLVDDRDVVLVSRFSMDPAKRKITVTFTNTTDKLKPPIDGVVRMPKLKGHWILIAKGPNATEVEYQVAADPGGSLPAWLVNLVSKKLPLKTLQGLRKEVKVKDYQEHLRMLDLSIDWTQFGFPSTSTVTSKLN